jgi:type I restriction enzyme, S subunit
VQKFPPASEIPAKRLFPSSENWPKSSLVPEVLFYFSQTLRFASHLTGIANGASYPAVTDGDVLDTMIPLPSVTEQLQLALLLKNANRLRRIRRHALQICDELLPAAFPEMFGDPTSNPHSYPVMRGEDLFEETRGGVKCGPFGSALKTSEYADFGIPVWIMQNVQSNHFIEDGCLYTTEEKFQQLKA